MSGDSVGNNLVFATFYRGRSVLVTGHTGFKGSWLSLWLASLGARVHGYALPPATEPSLFQDAAVEQVLHRHTIGDVRDPDALLAAVRDAAPEIVFHLAAQPLVRRSYREPQSTFDVNVMGTVNLLEAVRQTPSVCVCQVITTDKCYENRGWVHAYRENDRLGGGDPYSASKACAELVVESYRRSFFDGRLGNAPLVSLASCRAGNVIGGGDWAEDRIIPDSVRALSQGLPVAVRNPAAVRPWQHVMEPLAGYLRLAELQHQCPKPFGECWNFGPLPTEAVPVSAVADLAVKAWGSGSWIDKSESTSPHEAHLLRLDATKAMSALGWRPVLSVSESIQLTMEWYRRHRQSNFDARRFTVEQIAGFSERMREQR